MVQGGCEPDDLAERPKGHLSAAPPPPVAGAPGRWAPPPTCGGLPAWRGGPAASRCPIRSWTGARRPPSGCRQQAADGSGVGQWGGERGGGSGDGGCARRELRSQKTLSRPAQLHADPYDMLCWALRALNPLFRPPAIFTWGLLLNLAQGVWLLVRCRLGCLLVAVIQYDPPIDRCLHTVSCCLRGHVPPCRCALEAAAPAIQLRQQSAVLGGT